mgnify:FL=1
MNQPLRIHSARKGFRPGLACCSAILLMMLSACGQRGPLFLPEDPETKPAAAEQPADDAQKPDKEVEEEDGAPLTW